MKKIIVIILVAALLLGLGFRIWQHYAQNEQIKEESKMMSGKPSGSSVTAVKTQKAVQRDIYDMLELVGEVDAQIEISVQPRNSGRIVEILANEGDYVKTGQTMAVLDNETALLQLKQAEADLNTAKANLRNSQNTLARAKTEQERYRELLVNKYISQQSFENVEDSYLAAQASEESYKAKLVSAEKEYELAVIGLNQTKIIAPRSGYVLTKNLAIGQNVSSSTIVYTMADLDKVKVKFSIDQKQAAKVGKGIAIVFETDAYPDEKFKGSISENSPLYDSASRAVTVSSTLNNKGMKLLPGMFGTVSMVAGKSENAIVVPSEAVILKNGKNSVFVAKGNIAELVEVTTGISSDEQTEILSGLNGGESVITVGQTTLKNGGTIEVLNDGSGKGNAKENNLKNKPLEKQNDSPRAAQPARPNRGEKSEKAGNSK